MREVKGGSIHQSKRFLRVFWETKYYHRNENDTRDVSINITN